MTQFFKTAETLLPGAKTLHGRYYTSPGIFDKEMKSIFLKSWIYCCQSSDLSTAGQFITINLGSESIIILRGNKKKLHAFFNVCRHRGTRICTDLKGSFSKSIQCGYHGWTYNLNGSLTGAPNMDTVAGFNKADYPLHSVSLQEWEGFIFINLSEEPEEFLKAFLPVLSRFSPWNPASLKSFNKISYSVNCNWKLILQNYSECYHCPILHPQLSEITPYTSGKNDLVTGPILGGYMELKSNSISETGEFCGPVLPGLPRKDQSRVYYYSIFPNMLISLHPDYVLVHNILPIDAAHCRIECTWLFPEDAMDNKKYNPQAAVDFWDRTNEQDWDICEQSYLGIQSSKYSPGPYSGQESLLAAFDQYYLTLSNT